MKEKNPLVAAVEEGLDALRAGRKLRRSTVNVKLPPKYSGTQIAKIRKIKIHASQAGFALYLGVAASTVRAWEQHQRKPSVLARRMIQLAEEQPEALRALAEA